MLKQSTVCFIILYPPRFFLEIRVIIKILKNPCYPINIGRFSLGKSKKKNFFSKKKIQNGRLKKTSFSSSANSQYFFMKISWIGPWISKIVWCKMHMVVRLSDISSKTGKKSIFCAFIFPSLLKCFYQWHYLCKRLLLWSFLAQKMLHFFRRFLLQNSLLIWWRLTHVTIKVI